MLGTGTWYREEGDHSAQELCGVYPVGRKIAFRPHEPVPWSRRCRMLKAGSHTCQTTGLDHFANCVRWKTKKRTNENSFCRVCWHLDSLYGTKPWPQEGWYADREGGAAPGATGPESNRVRAISEGNIPKSAYPHHNFSHTITNRGVLCTSVSSSIK